jgi:hypothetical protein
VPSTLVPAMPSMYAAQASCIEVMNELDQTLPVTMSEVTPYGRKLLGR